MQFRNTCRITSSSVITMSVVLLAFLRYARAPYRHDRAPAHQGKSLRGSMRWQLASSAAAVRSLNEALSAPGASWAPEASNELQRGICLTLYLGVLRREVRFL